jgi:hypothetical protein
MHASEVGRLTTLPACYNTRIVADIRSAPKIISPCLGRLIKTKILMHNQRTRLIPRNNIKKLFCFAPSIAGPAYPAYLETTTDRIFRSVSQHSVTSRHVTLHCIAKRLNDGTAATISSLGSAEFNH